MTKFVTILRILNPRPAVAKRDQLGIRAEVRIGFAQASENPFAYRKVVRLNRPPSIRAVNQKPT